MVPSASTTLFEATIPYTSLRPLSRVLVGLSRIGDELCFEATTTKVMLSAMNLSKSAFGIVTLNADAFFTSYKCRNQDNEVRCKMQIRVSDYFYCCVDGSFFSVSSRRVTSRRERTKIQVPNRVKLELWTIR